MSKNFSEIEAALARDKKLYSKTHLLSVSFDPAHDTPPVLRRYASEFAPASTKPGFEHWGYAVAPANELKGIAETFGLFYNEQNDQIAHSMSTTVISPDGKVYKWYHDNTWNPEEVLADVKSLLASESNTKPGGKVHAPKIRAAVAEVPSK
jgi:protein SCO1/2